MTPRAGPAAGGPWEIHNRSPEKLRELRDQGILGPAEFEAQKAKRLGR
ncbi:SHOCT domain-containing protein [Streptomyces sp. NPDC056105]